MAGEKISAIPLTAVVADLTATTAGTIVSTALDTVPVTRRLTLGVLRDWFASAATGFTAVTVTVGALTSVGNLTVGASTFVVVAATGATTIGVAANAVGSAQPLELVGTDSATLIITAPGTGVATAVEASVGAFIPAASGTKVKVGGHAFQWANKDTTVGFSSWNVHVSDFSSPGVQRDNYALAVWARQGAAFFPVDTSAASAPGLNILQVNGALTLSGVFTSNANNNLFASTATNALLTPVIIQNANIGNAAGVRLNFGNNTGTTSATITKFGSNHATLPSYFQILNQESAPLQIGGYGGASLLLMGNAISTLTGSLGISGIATAASAGAIAIGGVTRATIGANGAAAALTVLPLGYLDVYIAGVAAQIPYYTRGA